MKNLKLGFSNFIAIFFSKKHYKNIPKIEFLTIFYPIFCKDFFFKIFFSSYQKLRFLIYRDKSAKFKKLYRALFCQYFGNLSKIYLCTHKKKCQNSLLFKNKYERKPLSKLADIVLIFQQVPLRSTDNVVQKSFWLLFCP